MDELTEFERRLATEVRRSFGPSRPVDALAVARSAASTPTSRRYHTMFSAARLFFAGVTVALFGGALFIAQPFGPRGDALPAVEGDATETVAAWVTGTISLGKCPDGPERMVEPHRVQENGWLCKPQRWETSDERLNGESFSTWNAYTYRLEGPDATVMSGIYALETASGSWVCRYGPTPAQGSGLAASTRNETVTCTGQGGHEGLMAVLDLDLDEGTIAGAVFPGEVPSPPELTAAD